MVMASPHQQQPKPSCPLQTQLYVNLDGPAAAAAAEGDDDEEEKAVPAAR